jgi:hypothetical protein
VTDDILKQLKIKTQENLEKAILKYQSALLTDNKWVIDKSYKEICKIYPPYLHMQEWWNQYHYLYDSQEDFASDYIKIFCNVLSNWKPRSTRKLSRYGGSGEFKNYFIGALQHNYINLVKADNAGKRNPTQKCPVCEKWVNPLSTHILHHHADILWKHLLSTGIKLEELERCGFCKSHKMPRSYECLEDCNDKEETACEKCLVSQRTAVIKKHILSKHSSLLFQKFNELYPDHQTVSPRALSVYLSDEDDGEGVCYYDSLKDDNKVGNFLKLEMNDVESKIIKNILNGNLKIKYDPKLYQCSISEFNIAVENIKNKMSIAGIEGNL